MHMTILFKTVQNMYSHTRCLGRHLWNCGMHEDNSLCGDTALLAEEEFKDNSFSKLTVSQ